MNRTVFLGCSLILLFGYVFASWDGPVQTIEREETIQEANEEAAAAQNDVSQINQNRVDEEEKNSIGKRDPHHVEQNGSSTFEHCLFSTTTVLSLLLRQFLFV